MLYSDESRFHVSTCDRCDRVWGSQGECYADCNIVAHDYFRGGSVMRWGLVYFDRCANLYRLGGQSLIAVWYRDKILHPLEIPFAGAHGDNFVFMQDNAHTHTAIVVLDFFEQEGINVMDWPA